MENYAGTGIPDLDEKLEAELKFADITPVYLPEIMRENVGEVRSIVFGSLYGWSFKRAWYYWICTGPGIPMNEALKIYATHGNEVRVDGHCIGLNPREQFNGLGCGVYHVDTLEGLKILADTIKGVVKKSAAGTFTIYTIDGNRVVITGLTIEEAFLNHRFNNMVLPGISIYEEGDSNKYVWDPDEKIWKEGPE